MNGDTNAFEGPPPPTSALSDGLRDDGEPAPGVDGLLPAPGDGGPSLEAGVATLTSDVRLKLAGTGNVEFGATGCSGVVGEIGSAFGAKGLVNMATDSVVPG